MIESQEFEEVFVKVNMFRPRFQGNKLLLPIYPFVNEMYKVGKHSHYQLPFSYLGHISFVSFKGVRHFQKYDTIPKEEIKLSEAIGAN
jgi:hypothetical protein